MGTAPSRQRARRPWRRCLAAAVVSAAGLSATVGLTTPASAESAFTLDASAQGVSLEIYNESFPLVQSFQANTPTAQARLNSNGQGSAYSAAPDPGHDVAELPATGAAQMCAILEAYGLKLPGCAAVAKRIPPYPYAYAQSGDKPQDERFAGAQLHAEARSDEASARTTAGADGAASATSEAKTAAAADGGTTASAVTSADTVEFGPALSLSGVRATADAVRDEAGKLTLTSSFVIGQLHVSGMDLRYEDGSFVLMGHTIPVPIPAQQVLSTLKAAGVTARFLPATKTKTGITSEGLLLRYTIPGAPPGLVPPLPLPLPVGVGAPSTPTTVTYVVGRAQVSSTDQAIASFDNGILGPDTVGSTPPAAESAPSSSTTPEVSSPTARQPLVGDQTATGTEGAQAAPPVVAGARLVSWTGDATDIYLAFVLTALALFGAVTAIRYLGVRLTWTS